MDEIEKSIKKNEVITVDITDVAVEGKSVGRVNDMVIFLNEGVPGDQVKAIVTKVKSSYAEGFVTDYLKNSAYRIQPTCTHTEDCGGCKWQHINYQQQLSIKQRHVIDAFQRIGKFSELNIPEVIPNATQFFYRNKMDFSFSTYRWIPKEIANRDTLERTDFALGLFAKGRYDKVVDLDNCFLQSDISNQIVSFIRGFALNHQLPSWNPTEQGGLLRNLVIREGKNTGECLVNLVVSNIQLPVWDILSTELKNKFPSVTSFMLTLHTGKGPVPTGEGEKICFGTPFFSEILLNTTFKIHPQSFFQTNTKQAEVLFSKAFELTQFKKEDIVYDLYCGPGTIGLLLANHVKKIIGIEINQYSIENANENARLNNKTNAIFLAGDIVKSVENISNWKITYGKPDVIILDPPRAGCSENILELLPSFDARKILYISCNPTTQARDLHLLCNFGYKIDAIQPVDMFPHTWHIENIVVLSSIK